MSKVKQQVKRILQLKLLCGCTIKALNHKCLPFSTCPILIRTLHNKIVSSKNNVLCHYLYLCRNGCLRHSECCRNPFFKDGCSQPLIQVSHKKSLPLFRNTSATYTCCKYLQSRKSEALWKKNEKKKWGWRTMKMILNSYGQYGHERCFPRILSRL